MGSSPLRTVAECARPGRRRVACLPVASHSPSGLTATARQSSSGPTWIVRSGDSDVGVTVVCHGDDPAQPVLGDFTIAGRQRQPAAGGR